MTFRPTDSGRSPAQTKFWTRDFVLALLGYFFLFMSVSMFFLLPLFLEQFTARQSRIGLIMGIHSVVAIAIRPVFGRMIDVRGGRKIALAGLVVMLLTVPLFHLVRDAGFFPFLLRALSGLGWGISMTATIAMCSDLAPVERLARSMGIIGVAGLVANALGPLLSEEIINRLGYGWLFNASLIFLVVSLGFLLATREIVRPERNGKPPKPGFLRAIPVLVIVGIAVMPVIHGSIRGAMIYFIAVFGKSIALQRVGLFFVFFSFSAILTRVFFADLSDRIGRKQVILPAALIIGLNLFLISQIRNYAMLVAAGFFGGFGQGLIFPALSTYIIDFLGRENKALAISLYLSFFDVGMGIGSPFFGWISDLFGYRRMYLFAGIFILAATAVFMLKAPPTEARQSKGGA
jgi:MFS family permease